MYLQARTPGTFRMMPAALWLPTGAICIVWAVQKQQGRQRGQAVHRTLQYCGMSLQAKQQRAVRPSWVMHCVMQQEQCLRCCKCPSLCLHRIAVRRTMLNPEPGAPEAELGPSPSQQGQPLIHPGLSLAGLSSRASWAIVSTWRHKALLPAEGLTSWHHRALHIGQVGSLQHAHPNSLEVAHSPY